MNESGTLNLARFEAYMRKLGSFDIKQFREKYEDIRYMERKTGKTEGEVSVSFQPSYLKSLEIDLKINPFHPQSPPENNVIYRRPLQPFFGANEEENDNEETQQMEDEPLESYDDQAIQHMMDMEEDEGSDYYEEEDRDKDRLAFFQEFHLHKRNYYQEKLEYEHVTP